MLTLGVAALLFTSTALADKYDSVDFNKQYDQGVLDKPFQERVKTQVESLVNKHGIVGATVVCVVDGKLRAAVAVGERKIGSHVPIEVTDPMHIGSNTKGMTALVFARLVEKGKLRWDETLGEAIGRSDANSFADVPLVDFLRQRSGITDQHAPDLNSSKYSSIAPTDWMGKGMPSIQQRTEARKKFVLDSLATGFAFSPGSKHVYANLNYITLGYCEELVSGQSWDDLVSDEVFTPLHMKASGLGPMGRNDDVSAPWQHISEGGQFKPVFHDNPPLFGPAGLVHCSVLDLANYAWFRSVGAYGLGTYLKPDSWKVLSTPGEGTGYACGIAVSGPDSNGVRDMSHGGSNNLSCSDWWVRYHGRVQIVCMVNCQSPEGIGEILRALEKLTGDYYNLR